MTGRFRTWRQKITRRKRWAYLAGAAALASALAMCARPSLGRIGASLVVNAPNRGAPAPVPREGELAVAVGPPAATLSVQWIDVDAAPATVFVLHGIRADRSFVAEWARMLAGAGFRAVLVDLRGHGRSTGDWLSYGVVESRDLAQVLDALEARGVRLGPIGVMGLSYGAATAIEWAGRDPRIRAVVAVAPFESLRAVVPGYLPLPLPGSVVDDAIDRAGQRGGFDPDEASPLAAVTRTTAPVLLVHGENDARIPVWHSQHILAVAKDHAELALVPGAGHASIVDAPVVRTRALGWFARYLRRAPEMPIPNPTK